MSEENTLYIQNDTGEYQEYTPPAFSESIPEDIRGNFEGVENVGQLAQNYVELQGQMPGKVKNIDAYKIEAPEGMELNDEMISGLKEIALEHNIQPDQVQGLVKWYVGQQTTAAEQFDTEIADERKQAEDALKKDWGDNYDTNMESVKKVIDTFGDDKFVDFLNETGLGNEPALATFLHKLSSLISEDAFEQGGGGGDDETPRDNQGRMMLSFPSMKK